MWTRPPPQPRPVLVRSSSQTHSGRGGRGNHRGGRHNNYNRGGSSSRRASSSVPTYDASMFVPQVAMGQDMQWYQNPQYGFQYTQQDLMTQMALHQENMRQLQLYTQSPAFLQHQQALSQQQHRMSSNSSAGQQQASDRSRTNSFDNPPLSAPLRPDLYALYGMTLNQPFFPQGNAGYGTYPTSPAATNGATQDYRRPLQRSEAGATTSNSSLRSHSQPASRSPSAAQPTTGYFGSQTMHSVPNLAARNINSVSIPSFLPDDTEFDETPKARSDSPQSEEGKYSGQYLSGNSSPNKQLQPTQLASNGVALSDVSNQSGPGRRRLSTDTPQTILDRRMRRTSRSPSPLGHSRTFSASTTSAPGSQNTKNTTRPLVVNGSGLKASVTASPRQSPTTDRQAAPAGASSAASFADNPLLINNNNSHLVPGHSAEVFAAQVPTNQDVPVQSASDRSPVVVNGSSPPMMPPTTDDPSFRERIAMMNSYYLNAQAITQEGYGAGTSRLSPSTRQRLMSRQPQNGVIAPLDLAIAENRIEQPLGPELAHLSPVYETRTPSPTVVRKFDTAIKQEKPAAAQADGKNPRPDPPKANTKNEGRAHGPQEKSQKGQKHGQSQKANGNRENGHTRSARSEGDGGWQKAGKGKKKGGNGSGPQGQGEQAPKNDSERKGG